MASHGRSTTTSSCGPAGVKWMRSKSVRSSGGRKGKQKGLRERETEARSCGGRHAPRDPKNSSGRYWWTNRQACGMETQVKDGHENKIRNRMRDGRPKGREQRTHLAGRCGLVVHVHRLALPALFVVLVPLATEQLRLQLNVRRRQLLGEAMQGYQCRGQALPGQPASSLSSTHLGRVHHVKAARVL